MAQDPRNLKATLKYWTLMLGVLQLAVGCAVGFIHPRWWHGIEAL